MNDITDPPIRRGLPPKHEAAALQLRQAITLPAGTILREAADGTFTCDVGVGLVTVHGKFSIDMSKEHGDTGHVLKRVVAA